MANQDIFKTDCLKEDAVFVGLVPINELRQNPHHVQIVNQKITLSWTKSIWLRIRCYLEGDAWSYWTQPIFTFDSGWRHTVGQMIMGVPATLLGYGLWEALSRVFGKLTCSKTTQAAFVLSKMN